MNARAQRHGRDLALAPQVRAQNPAGDSSLGSVVDQDGQRGTTRAARDGAVDGGNRDTTGRRDGRGGVGGWQNDSHDSKFRTGCEVRKGKLCT